MPTDSRDAILQLTAAGVSVLIDATGGQLPAIVHWGAGLPALTAQQAETLVGASVPVTSSNTVDLPPRPGLLPGHYSGWTGRPGLRGSFDGIGWSPKFRTQTVALNGTPVTASTSSGPGLLEISALDDAERLRLDLTLELLPGGLLRSRAQLTNLCDEKYTVEDLALSFPIPSEADGTAGLRRQPQLRTHPPAGHAADRHAPAREPQRPHRRRQRVHPARRNPRIRIRPRRSLGRPHGLERKPPALRRTRLHRRATARRRGTAPARRNTAGPR